MRILVVEDDLLYIGYPRDKIDRPFGCDSIETVGGVGYRLRADPPPASSPQGPEP